LRSGGTPAIESPSNAEAWPARTTSAALALAKLACEEGHLWRAELDATRPQPAEDMRRILSAKGAQTDGLYFVGLVFGHNSHGRPFLVGTAGVRFSVSHSHGLVLLAFVRDRDIGVDVEHIREDLGLDEIAARHFSTREVATLRSLPNSLSKEAFFSRFEVTLTSGEPAMLLDVEEDIREPFRWDMQELIPGPGYAAALVVEGHTLQSSYWQYTG
jgi:hypothetical protein